MQPERARRELCGRGVWEAPYLKDGCVVLVAIDSRGEERKRVKLLPGISYERAKAWLEELLDRVDAVPKIELVADTPLPRRPARPTRPIRPLPYSADPYDRRAYRNRLIAQAAHRIRLFSD